jgi:Flp pilus assembly protein TadG
MRRSNHPRLTTAAGSRRLTVARNGERGVSILEFCLVVFPMLLMMFGVVVIGVDLGRAVQVAQICRDADSMFSRGVPFYSTSSQNYLIQLGQNMNLQSSGGDGLIILSKIQSIPDPAVCGLPTSPGYATCATFTNSLVQRIQIGNTSITGSGTRFPTSGAVTYDSLDQVNNYLTSTNAEVPNFSTSLALQPNEISYVAEAYFQTTSVGLGSFQTSPGIYSQAFF